MEDPGVGVEPLRNNRPNGNTFFARFPKALLDPARSGCVLHQLDSTFRLVPGLRPLFGRQPVTSDCGEPRKRRRTFSSPPSSLADPSSLIRASPGFSYTPR